MTGRYTHGHHESVLRSHRTRTATNSAAYLLAHLRAGMTLLDVGSGPGTITADLAQLVAPGLLVALENTDAAADLTRAELARREVTHASVFTGDAHALDFADDSFDVVHAHQVLQHLADPVTALREFARVTRPGGVVAARDADYAGFHWFPRVPALDDWLELYSALARANGGEPDAGRHFRAWANAAQLTDVAITADVWCYADPESTSEWGQMWADRARAGAFAEQALQAGATAADLDRIADAWLAWAAHPDAMLMIPHAQLVAQVGR